MAIIAITKARRTMTEANEAERPNNDYKMIVRSQTRAERARCRRAVLAEAKASRAACSCVLAACTRTRWRTQRTRNQGAAAGASAQPLTSPVRVACHHDGCAGARRRLPT